MNGGKDVKIGHDKRPVAIIPKDEVNLYNIANGELLTDEFGNPLITQVDQFFLNDATAARSTSVGFPDTPTEGYSRRDYTLVGTYHTAKYGAIDGEIYAQVGVADVGGTSVNPISTVGIDATTVDNVGTFTGNIISNGNTITNISDMSSIVVGHTITLVSGGVAVTLASGAKVQSTGASEITLDKTFGGTAAATAASFKVGLSSTTIPIANWPYLEVVPATGATGGSAAGVEKHRVYGHGIGIGVSVGDLVEGNNIPNGTFVTEVSTNNNRLTISESITGGPFTDKLTFRSERKTSRKADNVWKIAEIFAESSEVSTTLLGVNRAETQLSLFSNVSSYGLDTNEFEYYTWNTGHSFGSWDNRANKTYGNRYLAKTTEEVQESAIQLAAFPPPYSYPFGPKFERIGLYNATLFNQYIAFVQLGNDLYDYYNTGTGSSQGYPATWKDRFLSKSFVRVISGDVYYEKNEDSANKFAEAFGKVDVWTDTWREISEGSTIIDPVTGQYFDFPTVSSTLGTPYDSSNTRPGYSNSEQRYGSLQSRRVFRYQPGRISGFTFGLKSSVEPVPGIILEWGIANPTDQYMFRIYAGQLSIIRRSAIPLEPSVLRRNGFDTTQTTTTIAGSTYNTIQPFIGTNDPYDSESYYTLEIPRDQFNGDPLNGNGPSGYFIKPENVTMWKIEFGWYGAIGVRFYAYIPAGPGEARWVVVHTLVIENSLGQPCLRDSYFRLKYQLDIYNTQNIKTPQYLYKYGASYYIDGGDEGTSQIYSVSTGETANSGEKHINIANDVPLIGITPKTFITNSTGVDIANKKLIIPTSLNITSDSLTRIKIVNCKGCPGFGHVYTPGVVATTTGRDITVEFTGPNSISATSGAISTFSHNGVANGSRTTGTYTVNTTSSDSSASGEDATFTVSVAADGTPTITMIGIGKGYAANETITIADSSLGGGGGAAVVVTVTAIKPSTYFLKSDEGSKIIAPSIFNAYIAKVEGTETVIAGAPNQFDSAIIKGFGAGMDGYPTLDGGRSIGGSEVYDYVTEKNSTINAAGTYPHLIRLSGYDVNAAADYEMTGSEIEVQFMNPKIGDSYSHFADFLIGLTDNKPAVDGSKTQLNGWNILWTDAATGTPGTGLTSVLPNSEILYGEHTHAYAGMNEDGIEYGEVWAHSRQRARMALDSRIPIVADNGGDCSKINYKVMDPLPITPINQIFNKNPEDESQSGGIHANKYYLKKEGTFPSAAESGDFDGGQVAILESDGYTITEKNVYFVGKAKKFSSGGVQYSYIEINSSLGTVGETITGITIYVRPIQLTTAHIPIKQKLYNYSPWPLYLVMKLSDKSGINNITIREISGDTIKTMTPILAIPPDTNISINNAGGKANVTGAPPPNYISKDRLSSATVDTQDQQRLRSAVVRDIVYSGANESKSIDLSKTFGADRNVITPDNLNIEATFLIAQKMDGGGNDTTGTVQATLNYKEQ